MRATDSLETLLSVQTLDKKLADLERRRDEIQVVAHRACETQRSLPRGKLRGKMALRRWFRREARATQDGHEGVRVAAADQLPMPHFPIGLLLLLLLLFTLLRCSP